MTDGATFQPMGDSDERRFGPRRILVCGFTSDEGALVARLAHMMTDKLGGEPLPVFVSGRSHLPQRLGELFEKPVAVPEDQPTAARAVILSGVSEREIHAFMAAYKTLGLERPLWATLTPTSQDWPLADLLDELVAERAALQRQGR